MKKEQQKMTDTIRKKFKPYQSSGKKT